MTLNLNLQRTDTDCKTRIQSCDEPYYLILKEGRKE